MHASKLETYIEYNYKSSSSYTHIQNIRCHFFLFLFHSRTLALSHTLTINTDILSNFDVFIITIILRFFVVAAAAAAVAAVVVVAQSMELRPNTQKK